MTAFALGRPLADFLVGKSLPPALLDELRAVIDRHHAIDEILSVQAVYIGPEEVIVSAKVRPSPRLSVEELGHAMDDLDAALRKTSPFVADVFIDVTWHHASELVADLVS